MISSLGKRHSPRPSYAQGQSPGPLLPRSPGPAPPHTQPRRHPPGPGPSNGSTSWDRSSEASLGSLIPSLPFPLAGSAPATQEMRAALGGGLRHVSQTELRCKPEHAEADVSQANSRASFTTPSREPNPVTPGQTGGASAAPPLPPAPPTLHSRHPLPDSPPHPTHAIPSLTAPPHPTHAIPSLTAQAGVTTPVNHE